MFEDTPWMRFFPGDKAPRPMQIEIMKEAYEALQARKVYLFEAQCGTGKTLCALIPALGLAMTQGLRVFISTNVKAQTEQFIYEARSIHKQSGVHVAVLFGKSSMCPHMRTFEYERCDAKSENTRIFVKSLTEKSHGPQPGAEELAIADNLLEALRAPEVYGDYREFEKAIAEATNIDKTPPVMCPYLLNTLLQAKYDDDGWYDFEQWYYYTVRHPTEIYERCRSHHLCPYEMVKRQLVAANLIICNYEHIIDPSIYGHLARWTQSERDEHILIFDEAHNLEAKAREHASKAMSQRTAKIALKELDSYEPYIEAKPYYACKKLLEVTLEYYEKAEQQFQTQIDAKEPSIIKPMRSTVDSFLDHLVESTKPGYEKPKAQKDGRETIQQTLFEAAEDVVEKKESVGNLGELRIGDLVKLGMEAGTIILEKKTNVAKDTGEKVFSYVYSSMDFLCHYVRTGWDPKYYPRLVFELDDRDDSYDARLEVKCCIPSEVTGPLFAASAGTVLMSATIAPFESLCKSLGIPQDNAVTHVYPPVLPPERRLTLVAGSHAILSKNRRDPTVINEVEEIIRTAVEATPGNVMVVTPTSEEARMYHEKYSGPAKKILDMRSPGQITEFFDIGQNGGKAVLFTYAWGSLVEGVDYKDERLRTIINIGVPIQYIDDERRAYQNAYQELYKTSGYNYACVYPAIRRVRQILGRVQRGDQDYGVRILVDTRYNKQIQYAFPKEETNEFQQVKTEDLGQTLRDFYAKITEKRENPN